jgi:hypothetical protein
MTAGLNKAGPVLILAFWLAVLAWLAPSRVTLRGDDFGYVDSVVGTIQAHRWVSSDWLGPLNLPLTAISATCFAVTRNFYISTFGLSLLLALVNFILLGIYLKPTMQSDVTRWLVVLGLALSPVWLNKALEYTGLPLGLACTLAAWLSWRRGWLGAFFTCVIVGVLNRQSAVCLLAWPLVALVREWRERAQLDWKSLAGIVVTLGVALTASLAAPPTWAREIVSRQLPLEFSPGGLSASLALAFVVLAGWQAGWGALRGEALAPVWRMNLARPVIPILCMVLGTGLVLGRQTNILWETPGMERVSLLVLTGATVAGAWLNRWDRRPPAEVLVFLAGYVLLVSMRGRWWDYYFFEPVLALMVVPVGTPALPRRPGWWLGTLLMLGVASMIHFKLYLRELEAKTVAYERALRAGEVRVVELSDAPFGFLGWKLLAAARARPNAVSLIDFMKFVEGARARFDDGTITVNREGGRKSIHPSRERWVLPADYRDRPLPLDNAEWRDYIRGAPVR